jgi:hypothetical protein
VVQSAQSRPALLAADRPSAATAWLTPSPKTRVGGLRHRPSGRPCRRGRFHPINTPPSRPCAYKTAPGRRKWPNQDPISEAGGINLYRFNRSNPLRYVDALGLEVEGEPEPTEADAPLGEILPIRYGPGQAPREEIEREAEDLLKRGGPANMEIRAATGEKEEEQGWLAKFLDRLLTGEWIFRGGGKNPGNLTPRPCDKGMLSGRDTLSNPYPLKPGQRPPLPAGKPIQVIDISKLPLGSVLRDGAPLGPQPPGHVSIGPNVPADVVKDAIFDTIPERATR